MQLPTPLVDTAYLAAHLGEPGLSVIDASWRMPGGGDARAAYAERHIPGAAFFPIDDIADPDTNLPHMLPSPQAFAEAVVALGVDSNDAIIVYDDAGLFSAARVWWTFRAMGHERVSVLDGGLPRWIGEGRPVEDRPPTPKRAVFKARRNDALIADAAKVRAHLAAGGLVLDARPAGRFAGRDAEPRPGLESGRMPGARNLPAGELVGPDGRLLPLDALRRKLAAVGVVDAAAIVTTCGSGVTAAILSLALARVGAEAGSLYDGSWAEWGRKAADRALFPVVRGES